MYYKENQWLLISFFFFAKISIKVFLVSAFQHNLINKQVF